MNKKHQISNLIYDFFVMRFQFRHYRYGVTLPSIDSICREFNVSQQTVKAAFRQLREDGFIDMHNGRPTRVIFQQTEQAFHESVQSFYSKRTAAFPDLFETSALILIPALMEGLRRTSQQDLIQLKSFLTRADTDDALYFFCYILQKLENPLIINLHWEISFYTGLIFFDRNIDENIYSRKLVEKGIGEIIDCTMNRDWDGLRSTLFAFQKNTTERSISYITRNITPAAGQIPFIWRIYYGRPQICYSLSLRLLHEIYLGKYRETPYLPSYEKMAREYQVSVSTMRRTIDVLSRFRAVESVNGIGTRVCPASTETPDFSTPAVRRNLALFFQVFELIILSCEEAACATFLRLTPDEKSSLLCRLEENLRSGRCAFSLWHILLCIAMYCPIKGCRHIYSKIYGLFLWGYPLRTSHKETAWLEKDDEEFTKAIAECIGQNRFRECSLIVREMTIRLFHRAENYLLSHGIQEDELRLSPAIRMMIPGESGT